MPSNDQVTPTIINSNLIIVDLGTFFISCCKWSVINNDREILSKRFEIFLNNIIISIIIFLVRKIKLNARNNGTLMRRYKQFGCLVAMGALHHNHNNFRNDDMEIYIIDKCLHQHACHARCYLPT